MEVGLKEACLVNNMYFFFRTSCDINPVVAVGSLGLLLLIKSFFFFEVVLLLFVPSVDALFFFLLLEKQRQRVVFSCK